MGSKARGYLVFFCWVALMTCSWRLLNNFRGFGRNKKTKGLWFYVSFQSFGLFSLCKIQEVFKTFLTILMLYGWTVVFVFLLALVSLAFRGFHCFLSLGIRERYIVRGVFCFTVVFSIVFSFAGFSSLFSCASSIYFK